MKTVFITIFGVLLICNALAQRVITFPINGADIQTTPNITTDTAHYGHLIAGSKITINNLSNPDYLIFEYRLRNAVNVKISISGNGNTVIQQLNSSSLISLSDKCQLGFAQDDINLSIQIPNDFPGDLEVKTVKIYFMDSHTATNKKIQVAFNDLLAKNEIDNSTEQIAALKTQINSNISNILQVYHDQNSLLVELNVADFINSKNAMSNPLTYDKFKESIDFLQKNNTDSVSSSLLNSLKNKLEESATIKTNSATSNILNIGIGILNGFTGGTIGGIFNGIKTIASSIINNQSKFTYKDGQLDDVGKIKGDEFKSKYNQGYKNFKVLNVLLDNLEKGQQSMNNRIQSVQRTAEDIDIQQKYLMNFEIEYLALFKITSNETQLTKLSKLTQNDLASALANYKLRIDSYLDAQIINPADGPNLKGTKRQNLVNAINKSAEGTIFNSHFYTNSKNVYGVFLDFANDLVDTTLIDKSSALDLDPTYVASVNNQFLKLRAAAINKYCSLMTNVVNTLHPPENLNERSKSAKFLCPGLNFDGH
jgi:hypothetical protein